MSLAQIANALSILTRPNAKNVMIQLKLYSQQTLEKTSAHVFRHVIRALFMTP